MANLSWLPLALLALPLLLAEPAFGIINSTKMAVTVRCCNKYGLGCNDLGVYKTGVACKVGTCCPVKTTIPANTRLTFDCYVIGEAVGTNTHWLHVTGPSLYTGWVSDKYVDCGGTLCKVPLCIVRQEDVFSGISLVMTSPLPGASWMTPIVPCFFVSYISERNRFNTGAPTRVLVNFRFGEAFGGIASTLGSTITVNVSYLVGKPFDYGLIAHEAMHVAQQYRFLVPGYWVEGLADFARHRYGCNFAGVWSLPPNPRPGDYYTSSYGVTARFLVWVDNKYPTAIVALNARLFAGTYADSFWPQQTGRTVQQLWAAYIANPAI